MTDTERLSLIEHYEWDFLHYPRHGWKVCGKFGSTATFTTIREAIDVALKAQHEWSTG